MAQIPSQADILEWIRSHTEKSSKRDIDVNADQMRDAVELL